MWMLPGTIVLTRMAWILISRTRLKRPIMVVAVFHVKTKKIQRRVAAVPEGSQAGVQHECRGAAAPTSELKSELSFLLCPFTLTPEFTARASHRMKMI
jgi:hypothetical protein